MSSFAAHILVSTLRSRLLAGGVVAGFVAATLLPSFSVAGPVEEYYSTTWFPRFRVERELLGFSAQPSAGFGHGPMKTDPKYPYKAKFKMAVVLRVATSAPRS